MPYANTAGSRGTNIRPWLVVSMILHGILFAAILLMLHAANAKVQEQEEQFIADVEEQERLKDQERQQEAEEAVERNAAEQVEAEMQMLIDDTLEPEHQEELEELTAEDIAQRLEPLEQQLDLSAMTDAEYWELIDKLRLESFEQLRANLEQMKRDLLISQVRQFIREQVAPEIKEKIEERLREHVGERVEQEAARQSQAERNRRLGELKRELDAAARELDAAGKDQERTTTYVEKKRPDVAARTQKSATQHADAGRERADAALEHIARTSPELAGKAEQLRTVPEDRQIRPAVERSREAIAEAEAAKTQREQIDAEARKKREKPDPQQVKTADQAVKKSREAATEASKQATERIEQRAAELRELAKAIDQEMKRPEPDAVERQVAREAALHIEKAAREKVTEEVAETAVPEAAKRITRSLDKELRERKLDDQKFQEFLEKDIRQALAEEMAHREVEAETALEKMRERYKLNEPEGDDLSEEEAAELARQQVDLEEALGAEQHKKAVEAVERGAEKAIEQHTRTQVAAAARSVNVDGILDPEQDPALAKMRDLEGRLDQMAANMADGRSLADAMGLGLLGVGQGAGLGMLPGENPWRVPWATKVHRSNRAAYEEFVKHMRDRMNPDNYYADTEEVDAPATAARPVDAEPVVIFVEQADGGDDGRSEKSDEERRVPEPDFKTLEFGAAAMMTDPVTIDGDLSDWGELRHGLHLRYTGKSREKVDDGPTVYVRWSPDGLYFGYTVVDTNGIQACPEFSWRGDCLEVMLDMANSRRKDAYLNPDAQKFQLTPFGAKGDKTLTIWEMGRGLRGLRMARGYPDREGIKGRSAARLTEDGYTVEGFLTRRALSRPMLVPGKYVGLNFSLNKGESASGYQWSASQQLGTWHRPDTWGDLLLLGADAELTFVAPDPPADGTEQPEDDDGELKGIIPGDVLRIEIADADMNLNTQKSDRVAAELHTGDGPPLFVVLAETGPNTGRFRASVNTQPYYQEPGENTLGVRSGGTVELVYIDARTEYGEQNREVRRKLPVGWPVMKVGSN